MYTDIVHIRIGQHTLAVVLDAIWGHTLTTVCLPACTADGGWWFGITFYGHIKPVIYIYKSMYYTNTVSSNEMFKVCKVLVMFTNVVTLKILLKLNVPFIVITNNSIRNNFINK